MTSGDTCGCHGGGPGMLLSPLQCPGRIPPPLTVSQFGAHLSQRRPSVDYDTMQYNFPLSVRLLDCESGCRKRSF